ncbi:MAG: hypothetical protein R3E32_29610 [Chitinophagales bacterium]
MKNISLQIARISMLVLLCTMTFTTLSPLQAHSTNNKQEDIKAMWAAYVVNKATLSGEEADKFSSIFRDYQDKLDEVKSMPDVSDQEVARLKAKQTFISELKNAFSPDKVNEILTAYKEFQIKILDYLKKKKQEDSKE